MAVRAEGCGLMAATNANSTLRIGLAAVRNAPSVAERLRTLDLFLKDAATQSVVRWYWTGSTWTGTDFAFAPGSGIYVVVVADFAWTPRPLTPYVP